MEAQGRSCSPGSFQVVMERSTVVDVMARSVLTLNVVSVTWSTGVAQSTRRNSQLCVADSFSIFNCGHLKHALLLSRPVLLFCYCINCRRVNAVVAITKLPAYNHRWEFLHSMFVHSAAVHSLWMRGIVLVLMSFCALAAAIVWYASALLLNFINCNASASLNKTPHWRKPEWAPSPKLQQLALNFLATLILVVTLLINHLL